MSDAHADPVLIELRHIVTQLDLIVSKLDRVEALGTEAHAHVRDAAGQVRPIIERLAQHKAFRKLVGS